MISKFYFNIIILTWILTDTNASKLKLETESKSPSFDFEARFALYPLFLHTMITSLKSSKFILYLLLN